VRGVEQKSRSRRFLGRRIEWTPSTGGFYVRPVWSYIPYFRADIPAPDGGVVQVSTDDAGCVRELLESPEQTADLSTPRLDRYRVFADDDADWPGLLLSVTGVGSSVVARVTNVALAKSIADALNRIEDAKARRPRTWGYWWRGFG
jgi:hypothetical protein